MIRLSINSADGAKAPWTDIPQSDLMKEARSWPTNPHLSRPSKDAEFVIHRLTELLAIIDREAA
jgi:hypothetical protein